MTLGGTIGEQYDMTLEARLCLNPKAASRDAPYSAAQEMALATQGFDTALAVIRGWPGYVPTPLIPLPARARALGLAQLHYKDESGRFGLKSFKALGGAYAVARLLLHALSDRHPGRTITIEDLLSGRYRDACAAMTVTSATDGNHGRAVAWGARLFGCRAVIFIHETVSEGRRAAIAAYGADVVRVPGGYDDSVRHAFAQGKAKGWHVVQDTATVDYRDVPAEITCGYGVIAREIIEQHPRPPSHVFVQAGVGGLASAICAVFWQAWGERRPKFIVVEPATADCVYRSLEAGGPTVVPGDANTFMAGLACGEVSLLAWDILKDGADAALAIDDGYARQGMRALAEPLVHDPPIVGGECSGGALGALLAIEGKPDLAAALGIDPQSSVLIIGTEGDTDPDIYREVVGRAAGDVLGRR
jgi:diaminopropionate ammonia-lyase